MTERRIVSETETEIEIARKTETRTVSVSEKEIEIEKKTAVVLAGIIVITKGTKTGTGQNARGKKMITPRKIGRGREVDTRTSSGTMFLVL